MDFNFRRFLAIARAAAASRFIPWATHGSAKEIVAAVPDRYALVAAAWGEVIDLNPKPEPLMDEVYWKRRALLSTDDIEKRRDLVSLITAKTDRALALMLDHFNIIPTREEVGLLLNNPINLVAMDEDRLRMVSETLVPVTTLLYIIRDCHVIFQSHEIPSFTEFAKKYKPVLL